MKTTIFFAAFILISSLSYAGCTPLGDQTTYGTNNVWIGYVYGGTNFNRYKGYVTEGISSSPNFDESFGGAQTTYNTNGCSVLTDTFSVRYKLTESFADGDYVITAGGDDGFRLSLDGGTTWTINQWVPQSYNTTTSTIHLSGSYNMVLEYFENYGDNRISFNITKNCTGSGNPAAYGTANQWIGYVYTGMNFNTYKGYVFEGSSASANFNEGFGGGGVTYGTSDCPITTTQFSVRYRLQTTLPTGIYKIIVGGDDGYRLSLDGGSTYVINQWFDQSYATTTYTATLSGKYNMVLEYYQDGGANQVSFNISGGSVLPVTLTGFQGELKSNHQVDLTWTTMMENDIDHYEMDRSSDGLNFIQIGTIPSKMTITTSDYQLNYNFTDENPLPGASYYRIKVVGKDNTINLSSIVLITNNQIEGTKIYPTLVQNNTVFVETDKALGQAKLEFFDLSGRKLSETNWESLSGRQTCTVSRSGRLPAGTYLARLTAGGQAVKNQLMIVQNN
jgi:hypothetical protein